MAKRTTMKQTSDKTVPKQAAPGAQAAGEGTRSSLISSIYARRYGSTSAESGVGVTPPSEEPKGRTRRK